MKENIFFQFLENGVLSHCHISTQSPLVISPQICGESPKNRIFTKTNLIWWSFCAFVMHVPLETHVIRDASLASVM